MLIYINDLKIHQWYQHLTKSSFFVHLPKQSEQTNSLEWIGFFNTTYKYGSEEGKNLATGKATVFQKPLHHAEAVASVIETLYIPYQFIFHISQIVFLSLFHLSVSSSVSHGHFQLPLTFIIQFCPIFPPSINRFESTESSTTRVIHFK